MKNRFTTLMILVWVLITTGSPIHAQTVALPNDEFESLMQKIRLDFSKNPSIQESLEKYNEQEGSFSDIDYNSTQRTHWPPLTHIERISDFVLAYTHPDNPLYSDNSLYAKIEKGLEFWHERNPQCNNWWYNQISEPQILGVLLIQMRSGAKQLPQELEQKILRRIEEDGGNPAKWTGANRTDIALHWIYRSCLQRNEKDLIFALDNIYNPVVYTDKEGFQHDNSNFQHGQQLYIGGYGDEIIKGVTQVAMYTHGTRFAIPQEKLELISKFMRETYYATLRGKYMSYDVLGRSVSRPNILDKSSTALYAKRMVTLDEEHAEEFKDIIARIEGTQPVSYNLFPKHTHYFRGDYTLHIRPHYTFDVRLVSNRTLRCEYGNEENLKTYFLSDGCTNITTHGGEYFNIFPVWDWTRIPGVTAPQLEDIPLPSKAWQAPGTSTFAGGVSDSIYGVTTYAYMDNYQGINTGAHKAWFFFDEEVVCLGSNIHSTSPQAVYTTVNQCLASPAGAMMSNGKTQHKLTTLETQSQTLQWILHDGIGYLFPDSSPIIAGIQKQHGTWYEINHSIKNKHTIEKEVFSICFDHGHQPKEATYAYMVVPGKYTPAEMEEYRKAASIEIVKNTASVQAVYHKKKKIWQIVFYQPGKFEHKKLSIQTDKACALIIKGLDGKHPTLHIADPGQTGQPIQVTVRNKKSQTIHFQPSSNPIYAGSTQSFTLN